MCFGAGFMLYIDTVIFIFGNLHENSGLQGSPGMFLLIAPPSVGVVSLDLIDKDDTGFNPFGEMLLGWVLVLLLLLFRLGPALGREPAIFGEYWTYVFPLSAMATATIRYASVLQSRSTEVLATIMIGVAFVAYLLVVVRAIFHMYQCFRGNSQWKDPLFDMEKYRPRRSR